MNQSILTGCLTMLITAVAHFGTTTLHAELYWDANGAAAGFGVAGGTWGSSMNWSTNALGTSTPDQPVNTTASNVLRFGSTTTGLAAGTTNVSGTQSFERVFFGLASDAITITDGTLAFATPASTVRLNSITNTIASTLAPGGKLSVRSLRPLLCDGFPTTTESILFANATLADYTGAESKMGGAAISNGLPTPTPASVYHWVNDGTNASFQVQTYNNGHTKAVKIALRQAGPHIAGKALYAKHCDPDANILGYDFDQGGAASTVATWFNQPYYGVTELKLLPYDDRFTQHRFSQFLSTNAQTIATNANLAEFSTAECFMAGGWVDDDVQPASTFYFVNNGARATFQAQCHDPRVEDNTKCVKVELAQVGSDIQARLLYAIYDSGNILGYNFDLSTKPRTTIATGFGTDGYGVRAIRLSSSQPTLALTAESDFNGAIDLAGSTLQLHGVLAKGNMSGGITNNGAIECRPPAIQLFSGPISGTGSFTVNGFPGTAVTYSPALTKTLVVIAENRRLADYLNAGGSLSGEFIGTTPVVAAPYFFTNNGTTATVQFQIYHDGHTKVVKVEFKQVDANIEAKIIYSKHCSPDQNNLGTDYDFTGSEINYGLSQMSLYAVPVRLSGTNTYSGGTYVNSGELEVITPLALPRLGGMVVNSGNLLLNVPNLGSWDTVVGRNPITVNAGGTLTLAGKYNAGTDRPIYIDGGVLHSTSGSAAHNENYLNNLTLMNGAQVTGKPILVGDVSAPTLTVSGTSPSTIASGICCVQLYGHTLRLNVADVTNDDNADLSITGVFKDQTPERANLPIIKSGAGTVSIAHSGNTHKGLFTIKAGCIALAADNAMNADNPFVLDGGALDMGTAANTVGTLTVTASGGTLALGSGSLSFANSSAITWGGTLTLTGTLVEGSVRFGSSNSGLTAGQLSAIEYNGGPGVRLNSSGYLTAAPAGSVIVIR
ncbi:MAG: hypothetical protein PHO37_04845 [Kiritimatiellae bacterium]|nr:hypothetical protein [Kiritimatiellia bacterium]